MVNVTYFKHSLEGGAYRVLRNAVKTRGEVPATSKANSASVPDTRDSREM